MSGLLQLTLMGAQDRFFSKFIHNKIIINIDQTIINNHNHLLDLNKLKKINYKCLIFIN